MMREKVVAMEGPCFGLSKKTGECAALKTPFGKAYQKSGACGTVDCPFYKPKDAFFMVRTEAGMRRPSQRIIDVVMGWSLEGEE